MAEDIRPLMDTYLTQAREETSRQAEVSFDALPNLCAEWYDVQIRSGADLTGVKDLIDQMEMTIYQGALTEGTFKTAGATNQESRDALLNQLLEASEAYQALLARQDTLRAINGTAQVNYKRYSRLFEVLKLRLEERLVSNRLDALSEIVPFLPTT